MDNPAKAPIVGYDGPAQTRVQEYWLDVAWRQLQREDRTLASRVANGSLDADTVADVVTAAARRVLRNPEGAEEAASEIDDYSERTKRADATEDVYFTAAELRRLLADVAPGSTGWAGSMKYS